LVGGAAVSLMTGYPAGAQVAQNDTSVMNQVVPQAGAPASFADLTEQLQPAVVNIATRQSVEVNRNPFAGTPFAELFNRRGGQGNQPQRREAQSLGSGFIISADGFVVTNNHVVTPDNRARLEEITVTMPDGTEYEAELIGADAASDLAVLKIKSDNTFPFVEFGDSAQTRVGEWVVAIGNPFGLGGTVTSGIVSAVYRNTGQGGAYDRFIQTDASINREIERGYLGVNLQPMNDDLADSLGLERNRGEIAQIVVDDSPAERAGLRAGDIIVGVNGQEVTSDQTVSFLVANIDPGETVPIEVLRDGSRMTINTTLGRRPSEEELAQQQQESFDPDAEEPMDPNEMDDVIAEKLGLQVRELTPQIARSLGVGEDTEGLVIGAVDPNSDAGRKGLRRGDIILSANYQEVTTIAALREQVSSAESANREAVLLRIQRRGAPPRFLPVRLR